MMEEEEVGVNDGYKDDLWWRWWNSFNINLCSDHAENVIAGRYTSL